MHDREIATDFLEAKYFPYQKTQSVDIKLKKTSLLLHSEQTFEKPLRSRAAASVGRLQSASFLSFSLSVLFRYQVSGLRSGGRILTVKEAVTPPPPSQKVRNATGRAATLRLAGPCTAEKGMKVNTSINIPLRLKASLGF